MRLSTLINYLALSGSIFASIAALAATPAENVSHPGPTIHATIERGDTSLPIFLVDHLHKGDKLLVTTDKNKKSDVKWLLVLATISTNGNKVISKKFDLTEQEDTASIDITADDQVPIVALAPQVRTLFGLHTSFSESANLIIDALQADPQRFVDLQKIDQISHAIAFLTATLDAAIQSQKPEQAIATAKDLAAKFGVKNVDQACFKDNNVNTKCVANSIVTSEALTVPSEDIWSAAGPNASAAKIPTDIFSSLKIVTEASTYLVNKYGDNYDFASSLGQRIGNTDSIQLLTNARFKSGDIKTAYVYVPSWLTSKQPELSITDNTPACLTRGEIVANIKGSLPLTNYWHDWNLELRAPDSPTILAQFTNLEFKPGSGLLSFDFKKNDNHLPLDGRILDATLTGKFGFADVTLPPFKVMLPTSSELLDHVNGLDSLVSGEKAKLRITGAEGNSCVEQMTVLSNDKPLANNAASQHGELNVDLGKVEPGNATLEIQQYVLDKQQFHVVIQKHRAHIQRLVHFDLETEVTAYGDNLDRIASIQAGHIICLPKETDDATTSTTSTIRLFSCSQEIASNDNFPAQVTVTHHDQEPESFDFPATKIGARPHMTVEGVKSAIITTLSPQALQWNLNVDDPLVTEDSGLGILLHAFGGYHLSHGPYMLQLKFADDPQTDQKPISVPLLSNLAHNELRTRSPISFADVQLPSVVNPIWYRVQHQPSGLVGDWLPLNRSAVIFPHLTSLSCSANGLLIDGNQLDLIDWASNDLTRTNAARQSNTRSAATLTRCDKGLCLGINALSANNKLRTKVHWIDDRLFDVSFSDVPNCSGIKSAKK